MEKPDKNDATLLLRLPAEMKEELQKYANLNGRRITAEINTRLRISLAAQGVTLQSQLARSAAAQGVPYPTSTAQALHTNHSAVDANDNGPANALTDIDRAMLVVFHTLPPEKQLALLSLFR